MTTRTFSAAALALILALPAYAPIASGQATDDATRTTIVNGAAKALRERYVFPDVAEKAAAKIEGQLASGAYKDLTGGAFTTKLTADLYEITHDKHLRVTSPGAAPPAPAGAPPPVQTPPARSEAGLVRADRLAGDIGYIEVMGYPSPQEFKPILDKAMAALKDTKALIIDERRNGGGSPDGVAYLVSYFVDPAKPMLLNTFTSRTPNTPDFTTREEKTSPTPTSYLGKPVYVLTSARTFSGGEEFAYDMQSFKLATLVGETTGGGANPGGAMPIGANAMLFVPNGRPVNAVTRTNWEGVGVIPEISVPAADALKATLEKLGQKPASGDIDKLSQASLWAPRSTAMPNTETVARRIIDGDAKGQPAVADMVPQLASASQQQSAQLQKIYAAVGPLKSMTFDGPGQGGGDTFIANFAYGSRRVLIILNAEGKASGMRIGSGNAATEEQRQAAFKAKDANADGKLDKAEYATVFEATGGQPGGADDAFTRRDADKDGFVTSKEYEGPVPS